MLIFGQRSRPEKSPDFLLGDPKRPDFLNVRPEFDPKMEKWRPEILKFANGSTAYVFHRMTQYTESSKYTLQQFITELSYQY